jgi:hypothetical protein
LHIFFAGSVAGWEQAGYLQQIFGHHERLQGPLNRDSGSIACCFLEFTTLALKI